MGNRPVVFGHIEMRGNDAVEFNRWALTAFPYDPVYPFPDIFHVEVGPKSQAPSIFLGGTFKEIERDWPEWLWRFASLLSTLEAVEATVTLDCWRGRYSWTLCPEVLTDDADPAPLAVAGHRWVITDWPADEADLEGEYDVNDRPALERRGTRRLTG